MEQANSLPQAFIESIQALMGPDRAQALFAALGEEAPVSIRLNPFKAGKDRQVSEAWRPEPVPWCDGGFYLNAGRPAFTFDPLLHAGLYYVQEAASMMISHVLRTFVDGPVMMLDLCAAPGGKSTCAMGSLPAGSQLVSNEPIGQRASILCENILKYGHRDIYVTSSYAKDFRRAGAVFDVILADVPCSGEGMFRKDPTAISEWSTEKVVQCQRLQREIVADIWPQLRPGGLFVYSTCTFNAHEDEENVAWMRDELGALPLPIPTEESWHITGSLTDASLPVCRFLPGISRGEGLFMAVLRKPGDAAPAKPISEASLRGVRLLAHGVRPDTIKGKNTIPDVSRALACTPTTDSYPRVDVTYEQAIAYLRRDAITLPPTAPRGIVEVCYRNCPLGFAKNIGNRANNLYPQEWKIRSTHVPDHPVDLLS